MPAALSASARSSIDRTLSDRASMTAPGAPPIWMPNTRNPSAALRSFQERIHSSLTPHTPSVTSAMSPRMRPSALYSASSSSAAVPSGSSKFVPPFQKNPAKSTTSAIRTASAAGNRNTLISPADQLDDLPHPPAAWPLGQPPPGVEVHPLQLAGADAPRRHQRGLVAGALGRLLRSRAPCGAHPGRDRSDRPGCGLRRRQIALAGLRGRLDRRLHGSGGLAWHAAVLARCRGRLIHGCLNGRRRVLSLLPGPGSLVSGLLGVGGLLQHPPRRLGLCQHGHRARAYVADP